eukprot:GILI01031510.1.p1 GENE.GILI01031510.1~~GILI01031510.1.p1  ORF type:complete len:208 (-),score=4.41 GILI01031510.1:41-664(-)
MTLSARLLSRFIRFKVTGLIRTPPKFNKEEVKDDLRALWLVTRYLCTLKVCLDYGFEFLPVQGPSMLPTINQAGDLLLIDKLTPRFTGYEYDDVVIAKSPTKLNAQVCKRIRAMEGDAIYVPPLPDNPDCCGQWVTVPKGYVWLEGDNSLQSNDSRYYGPVPLALVTGRVVCRVWPMRDGLLGRLDANPLPGPASSSILTRGSSHER